MKSLKGRFIRTNIIMIAISAALVILIAVLLLIVFSFSEPYGFQRILKGLEELQNGCQNFEGKGNSLLKYMVLGITLSASAVMVTCVMLSILLSRAVLVPLKELQVAAANIAEGKFSFEILGSKDKELNDLCLTFDEIRKKFKESSEQESKIKEERNMLMANLSHDMRTPITTIKGYLEGIQDGVANTPEKISKYLATIYDKALMLEKLVDSMTEYSEMELGRMQYEFEFVDVSEFLRGLAQSYAEELKQNGMTMIDGITQTPLYIVADTTKLKRVFDNLISNGIKYNHEGGSVTISAGREGNGALICITDTGSGIPKGDLSKVFEGFYRGDAARSNIKGNGLGLGISKQIVESHRGKIWIKSQKNSGTGIFVYLPLREKEGLS